MLKLTPRLKVNHRPPFLWNLYIIAPTTLVPILDEVTDHQRVMLVGLVVLVTLVHSGVTSPGVEVDDLTGKQFEAALETEENLAVYWCKYFIANLNNSRDFLLITILQLL